MKCLRLNDESGMVMVVAVMVTLIGSILAGSYMAVVLSEFKNSIWQKQRAQSLFLAEAGLEKGLYYLNNVNDTDNPWTDNEGQVLSTPLQYMSSLSDGYYDIKLYDQADMPSLPAQSYLIKSVGIIPQESKGDIERDVSCIVARLQGLPIPAALSILDDTDPEDELEKFQSNAWTIQGKDIDGSGGLPGIGVANTGDDLVSQLGIRLDQVTGSDEWGNPSQGSDAILEDPTLPKNLDAYLNYFRRIGIDISGMGSLPASLLGTGDDFQIIYADLSKGPIKIAGTDRGSGILLLEGNGEFEMAGGSVWSGVIICAGDSHISLKGGGAVPAHIDGALLISNGTVEMNGTADVRYSSGNLLKVNDQLLLYQVYAWCGGWGGSLDKQIYSDN